MKDNRLLLILCIILIVVVLYYIFKTCRDNNSYSNKLDTYKNNNTIVKLNKNNEQISRDLFEDTNENFNINDFIFKNNIMIIITNNNNNNNNTQYIKLIQDLICISDSNEFDNSNLQTLFVKKIKKFESETLEDNYNLGSKAYVNNPFYHSEEEYSKTSYCGPQFKKLTLKIIDHYETNKINYRKFYRLDDTHYKLGSSFNNHNEIEKKAINQSDDPEKLSTYYTIPFYYKNDPSNKKTLRTVRDQVNLLVDPNSCGDYDAYNDSPDFTKFIENALGTKNTGVINDISPYKFIEFDMNNIYKMFYINKDNMSLIYDNNEFKFKIKDDINRIIIIYYDAEDNDTKYLSLQKDDEDVNGESFDYSSSTKIIIGIIIPLGKKASVTYKSIERSIIENDNNEEAINKPDYNYTTFDNVNEQTITLTQSSLYVDRHIEGIYNDDIDPIIDHSPYTINHRHTQSKNAVSQIKLNNQAMLSGLYMKSHYRYIDKNHAKKKSIKITNIVLQDNSSSNNLTYDNTPKLITSSNTSNININFNCYNPSIRLDKILVYSDYDPSNKLNKDNYLIKPTINNGILKISFDKLDVVKEQYFYNKYSMKIIPKRINDNDDSDIIYYELENRYNINNIRLYIIETISGFNDNFFILVYYNGVFKFLQRTETETIILNSNYDDNNKLSYIFKLKEYIEEPFNTIIDERFEDTTNRIDKYIDCPMVIDSDSSSELDATISSALYTYQSGIYTANRYLILTNNFTIKTNDNNFILLGEKQNNNYRTGEERDNKKLYIDYKDNKLQTNIYRVSNNVNKDKISIYYKEQETENKYKNINGLTYGSYLVLKNKNGEMLQCIYDIKNNNDKKYNFVCTKNENDKKFYSLYKNGVLQESYSPFFNIENNPNSQNGSSSKIIVFAISDHIQHLKNNVILEFNGYDKTNAHKYYEQCDYYEIKNIFETPMKYKSSSDIQIDINTIDMIFNKTEKTKGTYEYKFEYNIELSSDSKYNDIIDNKENYIFDYYDDLLTNNMEFINVKNITLDDENEINKYMIEQTKNMEKLVGCLNNTEYNTNYYKQLIGINKYSESSEYNNPNNNLNNNKCEENIEGSLNIKIKNLKNIKQEKEDITKSLLVKINNYKNQAILTIEQTIIPIQRELYNIIYEIYNKDIEIEELNYKIQNKIQFSFNISRNITYLEYLKKENENANKNIKELTTKMNSRRRNDYIDLLKVNEYILKINKNIININLYLEKTKNIKEQFNSNIVTINGLNNIYNVFNTKIDGYFENIKKLSKIIRDKVNTKDKINNEIKLNDEVNKYYDKIITILINKQISNNDYTYSDEYRDLPDNNYMKIFGELVLFLNKKKMELNTKLQTIDEKLLNTKRKLKKNNFKQVDYKVNYPQTVSLEIDLVSTYEKIDELKQKIKNDYILKKAQNKLEEINNLNLQIKEENVNTYNVLEPFVSSNDNNLKKRFNTIQSHTNGYLSVLPNNYSNEYKININGKCLSSYSSNDYNIQNCDNKQSQYFEPRLINSKLDSESINKDRVNDSGVEYPYYQMVSSLSRDCLTKEGDNVSITPCTSNNKNQRWNLIENEVKCLDN